MGNRSYVTVSGIGCDGTEKYVTFWQTHHIEIAGGVFENSTKKSGWPIGFQIADSSHHNWIHHNKISNVGYHKDNDDKGGIMNIGAWQNTNDESHYNLIENNEISGGGHHLIEVASSYNVIRNNYFHNEEWTECQRAETGGLCGNRSVIIDGPSENVKYNVIEGNTFAFSGIPPDQDGSHAIEVRTGENIVRNNVFYSNDLSGLSFSSPSYLNNYPKPHNNSESNSAYHNVFFQNGYPAIGDMFQPFESGLSFLRYGSGPAITDVSVKNNIFWENRHDQGISFYRTDASLQIISHNWEEAGDPLFVDDESTPDPLNPDALDFHLQAGSPAIDAGTFLTQAVGSGVGNTIQVDDARYFSNGWGIVAGDLIQLEGTSARIRIISIDYNTHTLYLDQAIRWTHAQGVTLPFNGTAPDIGAFEF